MKHAREMGDHGPEPTTICGKRADSVQVVLLKTEADRMVYRTSAGDVCPTCQAFLRAWMKAKGQNP